MHSFVLFSAGPVACSGIGAQWRWGVGGVGRAWDGGGAVEGGGGRGGLYVSAGPSVPFATWSGTGWCRYAICGGTFIKKLKLPKRAARGICHFCHIMVNPALPLREWVFSYV